MQADLIVLAGATGPEQSAKTGGYNITARFIAEPSDTSLENTDLTAFAVLEPTADGFRNYFGKNNALSPVEMLEDKANLLTLTVPEMTVLFGDLRSLDANIGGSKHGVFTNHPCKLSNDYFVNLLNMSTTWSKSAKEEGIYEGHERKTGKLKWIATPVDLLFCSNFQLRAVTEAYASVGAKQQFADDFVKVWNKVMTLERFDLM